MLAGLYIAARAFQGAAALFIHEGTPAALYYLFLIVQEMLFYGLPAFLYMREARGIRLPALTLKRPADARLIVLTCLAALLHQIAMQLLTGVFGQWLRTIGLYAPAAWVPMPKTFLDGALALPALALVPALCEEYLFRGAVFPSLQREFSDGHSVVLTALLFALMHGSLPALPSHFFAGLVATALAFETGGLFAPVIYHGMYNAASYLTDALAPIARLRVPVLSSPSLTAALTLLALLFSLFVLAKLFVFRRPYQKRRPCVQSVIAMIVVALGFLAAYLPSFFPI